jgi:hypothetical protein
MFLTPGSRTKLVSFRVNIRSSRELMIV